MPSLNMRGPYKLTIKTIDREVTQVGPGNYALGHLNKRGQFVVRRVYCAYGNIKDDLKGWVGEHEHKYFKFSSAMEEELIFNRGCHAFHGFESRLDDKSHPAPAPGREGVCPVCGQSVGE